MKQLLCLALLYFLQFLRPLKASKVIYNVASDCKGSSKNVRILHSSQSSIFYLSGPADCHYELEVTQRKGFGFHIFIENLDFKNGYLQFGRDVGVVTSFQSQKFKQAKNMSYVEEVDFEMDIWIKTVSPESKLNMTVTIFKKFNCDQSSYYQKCPNSRNCIDKNLFCDGLVNCHFWSQNSQLTDESYCLEKLQEESSWIHSNIPLFIVILVSSFCLICLAAIFAYRIFLKQNEVIEENYFENNELTQLPKTDNQEFDPPPSYEEATKSVHRNL